MADEGSVDVSAAIGIPQEDIADVPVTDERPSSVPQELEDPGTPLENEQPEQSDNDDDDDEEDEEDDIKITIGDLKTSAVGFQGAPGKRPFNGPPAGLQGKPLQKLDIDASAQINGTDIYDLNVGDLEEKPWRKPGADITDYFNYGFTEDTWQTYCERQRKLRAEFGAQQANKILFSAVGGLGLVAPGCISNDGRTKTVVNLVKNVPSPFGQDNFMQQQPVFRKVITVQTPNAVLVQGGPAVPAPVTPIASSPPPAGSTTPVSTPNGITEPLSAQSTVPASPSAISTITTVGGPDAPRFPNMSLPPPMFPPTNLPPPGFGPPGMHLHPGMPPTSLPPPGMPPHMMPPPPGVPGGAPGIPGHPRYGFPPPMRGPLPMHNQPPPGFPPMGERPPYHPGPRGWAPGIQQPGPEARDRSPASYSDKSSGVDEPEDRERVERPRRRREAYIRDRERYSHTDRSPSKSSSRHREREPSSRSHRRRSHSRERHQQHSSDKERHRDRSDKDRERRYADEDDDRHRKRKKKTREEDEVDLSRVKIEPGSEERRSKRRRDEDKKTSDEPLAPGIDSADAT